MRVERSIDGGLRFIDMITFSLKFMLKRRDTLYFFIPALAFGVLALLISGYLFPEYSSNPEYFLVEASLTELMNMIPLAVTIALIGWALTSYASMCVYAAASMEFNEEEWNARDIMTRYLGRFPGFLAVSVLIGLIILSPLIIAGILGLLIHPILFVLFIPAIPLMLYLSIRLLVSEIAYIVEGKGIVEAINRSLYLTRNKFWYVFLRSLAFGILAAISYIFVILVIGSPSQIISYYMGDLPLIHPLSILSSIITDLVNYYYLTSMACFSFLIFNSLVFMKDKARVEKPLEPEISVIH